MPGARRGRLSDPSEAPPSGERTETLARLSGVQIEHILSGQLDAPVDYLQDHDEWVVVLAGEGSLEMGDESVVLAPGDWVMIPSGTPHRLLSTRPGTSWLAVHVGRPPGT